ncbi:MAG: wax ester/triacylglycerol synthase family O-acyltransferase [Acidimicrobiia bacterium]|nr:wax ester/triacylglycerol synthase family O-acyltransferase [Acidimicrobiia bacterium]
MSGVDAAFLYGETPAWHMHVSAVAVVDPPEADRPFDFATFRDQVEQRVHLVPQFRWRLVEVPLGMDRPVFVDDPDFNMASHIFRIGVPPPGGPEQLGNLIGELVGIKLDRSRPLWEMWYIEGLEDGRVAILGKVHHAIIDGVSGSELATVLLDLEPDPPPPPPEGERHLEPLPDTADLLARGFVHTALTPWRIAQFGVQTVRQAARFIPFRQRRTPPPIPFQAPRTSFNAELTASRRFSYTSVSLDRIRAVKNATGVKVNDVILAVCAGALRRYLLDREELPDAPLIAQVPVSLRSDDTRSDVGTKVGAMFASLATDVVDPLERLATIHESTTGAKEMQRALAAEKIMGISETAPPAMIDLAARMYTLAGLDRAAPPVMNLIISNVPGPPFPIYCNGGKVAALYPMGPLLYGTGINVTVFSYCDDVDFGFMVCRDLVPEPWSLVDGVHEAMRELEDALAARADGTDEPVPDDPSVLS